MEVIISYLDFSSIINLASSHPCLAHLQPKEQLVVGKDFLICGEGGCTPEPHFPEVYFDVRVETGGLLAIKMVWQWRGRVCDENPDISLRIKNNRPNKKH